MGVKFFKSPNFQDFTDFLLGCIKKKFVTLNLKFSSNFYEISNDEMVILHFGVKNVFFNISNLPVFYRIKCIKE